MPDRILALDDQPEVLALLGELFAARGKELVATSDPAAALAQVANHDPKLSLCILDLELGEGRSGLDVLADVRRLDAELPVIILTGKATVDAAVRAVKAGAADFIEKDMYLEDKLDLSVEKIERMLSAARERRRLEGENRELRADNLRLREVAERRSTLVGDSAPMREVRAKIERVARVPRPVLVLGERGTGKELVAAAIHRASPRAQKPFVTMNCAAVTETLLESELFGHESGAFTGATRRKEGRFELADGGTLFLDEIGNMSLEFQTKVLRVLEYQRFERVGGARTLTVDVRLIAATNIDLQEAMAAGRFRRDLYDRLAFEVITLPALRQRLDDLSALAVHLLERFRHEVPGIHCVTVCDGALARLAEYDFPGNVRELKNILERAAYSCDAGELSEAAVAAALPGAAAAGAAATAAQELEGADLALPERVAAFERGLLLRALERYRWNQRDAAHALGITYDQFRHMYRKYGLREGRE